jgi:hypothetical protein
VFGEEIGRNVMALSNPFALSSALIALAAVCFWGYCLFDLARTDEREVRTFSKPVWVVLLVFTNILGALMWFGCRPASAPIALTDVTLNEGYQT